MKNYTDLADFSFQYAQDKLADYVEVRLESNIRDTISFINGNLHIGNLPIDLTDEAFTRKTGLNIRLIVNGGLGMCSTNQLTKDSLKQTVDQAYNNAKRGAKERKVPMKLSEEEAHRVKWESDYDINPMEVPLEEKVEFFQDFVKLFSEKKYPIEFIHIFVLISEQRDIYYLNSDGSEIQAHIPRVAFLPVIIGIKPGGKNEQLMLNYATTSGWDELISYNIVDKVREKIGILADIIIRN
jgi:predicted Zn-dependent protease